MAKSKLKIFHFDLASPTGNFGDDVLFLATKDTFRNIFHDFSIEWVNYPVRNHTTDNVIKKANTCDLVVVGGGGLLLKDTNPNRYSGWQWACSTRHLEMIRKPLIIYSIGYNRFREQEEFDDVFFEHIRLTVDKAAFFSVRNTGSKRALVGYGLPSEKIVVNPCPSIFYSPKTKNDYQSKRMKIGINLAGDREHLRFDKQLFYDNMRKVITWIQGKKCEVEFVNHSWNPQSNCQDFIDSLPGPKKVHNIETMWNRGDIDRAVNLYRSMGLVIAMRGHAQMIPFGQHTKVISLISHDKLRWFLEDIGMEDTGVDVSDEDFGHSLMKLVENTISSHDYSARQETALEKLRAQFLANNKNIRELIL